MSPSSRAARAGSGRRSRAASPSRAPIVAAGYSRDREHAERLLGPLRKHGVDASIHQGNVGSADDCRRTIASVIDQHGRIDVLVNNAGITIDKTVLKLTDEDWNKVISVNLSGAFFTCQAVLPHMIERGTGRIINISSIIGETGNIGQANYAASKSGLFGLTKTLAREAAFQLQQAPASCDEDVDRCHRERRRPRVHRDRDARAHPGEGAGADQVQIPVGRSRPARRRSPASCTSSPPTTPRSSPARSGT